MAKTSDGSHSARASRHQASKPVPVRAPSTDWNKSAQWYDELVGERGHFHHEKTIIPGLRRMLKLKPGDHLLDVACGQGVICRAFAKDGIRVTGVDMAPDLIDLARQRMEFPGLESYHVADARRLTDCIQPPGNGFDAACCVLAIANMTPLSPVWKSIAALLRPGAALAVVMLHPCFRIPRSSDWNFDAAANRQARTIGQYLTSSKIPIDMHPGQPSSEVTQTFHRPLQAYVNTLVSAGFLIEHLEEWISEKRPPHGSRFAAMEQSRKEIPLFLAIKARQFHPKNV